LKNNEQGVWVFVLHVGDLLSQVLECLTHTCLRRGVNTARMTEENSRGEFILVPAGMRTQVSGFQSVDHRARDPHNAPLSPWDI